jgi:hypothetical protein
MFEGNESVTVIGKAAGSVDEYGIPTQTITENTVVKCLVEFDSTSEPASADTDPIVQTGTVYFPLPALVGEFDELEIRGERWVKDGSVVEWNSPFGRPVEYAIVKVRRRLA